MEYYITLLIIYLIAGLLELTSERKGQRSTYLFLLLFPLFALTAFRGERIGNDTLNYVGSYDSVRHAASLAQAMMWSRMEAGYVSLSYWVANLGMSFFQFQIVTSFFIYSAFYNFIRNYSPNYAFSCLLLMTTGCMAGSMCVIRMYIAMGFLLYSVPCILHRKWIRFLILVILAALFHKSSAFFGIMLPLCVIPYSKKFITLMLIGAIGVLYMGVTFFQWLTESIGVYEGYTDSEYFNEFNTTAVFMMLLINVAIYIYTVSVDYFKLPQFLYTTKTSRKKKVKEITISYYNRMSMLVTLCLSIIGLSNTIMSRISGYFSVCLLVMLPATMLNIRNRSNRIQAYLIFALLYIAYFMAIRILRPNWNHISPYEWGF